MLPRAFIVGIIFSLFLPTLTYADWISGKVVTTQGDTVSATLDIPVSLVYRDIKWQQVHYKLSYKIGRKKVKERAIDQTITACMFSLFDKDYTLLKARMEVPAYAGARSNLNRLVFAHMVGIKDGLPILVYYNQYTESVHPSTGIALTDYIQWVFVQKEDGTCHQLYDSASVIEFFKECDAVGELMISIGDGYWAESTTINSVLNVYHLDCEMGVSKPHEPSQGPDPTLSR